MTYFETKEKGYFEKTVDNCLELLKKLIDRINEIKNYGNITYKDIMIEFKKIRHTLGQKIITCNSISILFNILVSNEDIEIYIQKVNDIRYCFCLLDKNRNRVSRLYFDVISPSIFSLFYYSGENPIFLFYSIKFEKIINIIYNNSLVVDLHKHFIEFNNQRNPIKIKATIEINGDFDSNKNNKDKTKNENLKKELDDVRENEDVIQAAEDITIALKQILCFDIDKVRIMREDLKRRNVPEEIRKVIQDKDNIFYKISQKTGNFHITRTLYIKRSNGVEISILNEVYSERYKHINMKKHILIKLIFVNEKIKEIKIISYEYKTNIHEELEIQCKDENKKKD